MELKVNAEVIKVSQGFDGLSIIVKTQNEGPSAQIRPTVDEVRNAVSKLTTGQLAPRIGKLDHNILFQPCAEYSYDLTEVTNWEEVKIEMVEFIPLMPAGYYIWEISNIK